MKICNCPTCSGNRSRSESKLFLAVMERSFGSETPSFAREPLVQAEPAPRTHRD
jgi:hypothetical protein